VTYYYIILVKTKISVILTNNMSLRFILSS